MQDPGGYVFNVSVLKTILLYAKTPRKSSKKLKNITGLFGGRCFSVTFSVRRS